MLKISLWDSSDCQLDTLEAPTNAEAFKLVAELWLENLTAGDRLVILHADEDDEAA